MLPVGVDALDSFPTPACNNDEPEVEEEGDVEPPPLAALPVDCPPPPLGLVG